MLKVVFVREIVTLSLNSPLEKIEANFKSSTRNKIKKAIKNGICVEVFQSLKSLKAFESLYSSAMQRLNADQFYHFKSQYFESMGGTLAENCRIFLATYEGKVVGGALILFNEKYIVYQLSAVDGAFLKLNVASLLRYEVIKYFSGFHRGVINFGGGLSASAEDPLLKFKIGFSKETLPFYIGKCVVSDEKYKQVCSRWEKRVGDEAKKWAHFFLKYKQIGEKERV